MLPTREFLKAETRNWVKRGVIPAEAARMRRYMAESTPRLREFHEAVANEWDRVAAKNPDKVIATLEKYRDDALACKGDPEFWAKEAAKYDAAILLIDPDYEPSR